MSRINIDVSKGELDYIREAIENKHIRLMTYLDDCEVESKKEPEPNKILLNQQQVEAMKKVGMWASKSVIVEAPKKPHWTQTAKGKKIMATRRRRGQK